MEKKLFGQMGVHIQGLAEDMFFRLVTEYADRQGVTEQLKSENQFLWIQK